MELNVIIPTNLQDPDLSLTDTNMIITVDKKHPYMAVLDMGRNPGFEFAIIKIVDVCSL